MYHEHAEDFTNQHLAQPSPVPSPNIIQLSKEAIVACHIPSKRTIYRFDGFDGLGLRITPKGTQTWIYTYTHENQSKMLTLGQHPALSVQEALKRYLLAKEKSAFGKDPSQEQAKRDCILKVSELIDRYEVFCQKTGKKDWKAECRKLRKDLLPVIGNKKVHLVTSDDLRDIFDHIIFERSAPSTATHLFAYTRRLFNYAGDTRVNRMKRRDNPCLDIRLGIKHKGRTRHLTTQEIYQFWHGVSHMEAIGSVKSALKLMLCTVTRGCEVRNLRWSDLNTNEGVWTLKETKNGRLHRIHIKSLAYDVLMGLNGQVYDSGFVFKSCRLSSLVGQRLAQGSLSQTIRRNFDLFDIRDPFTPHDLRRTAATIIAAMTGQRSSVKRALNHTENDVTDIYDQYVYDKEKSAVLGALNFALDRIISSPSINQVPTLECIRDEYESMKDVRSDQFRRVHNRPRGLQATFSSPAAYTLSFDQAA